MEARAQAAQPQVKPIKLNRRRSAEAAPSGFFFYQVEPEGPWHEALAAQRETIVRTEHPCFTTILDVSAVPDEASTKEELAALRYSGPAYFDFDGEDIPTVLVQFRKFLKKLEDLGVDLHQAQLFATGGRGFHCLLDPRLFVAEAPKGGVAGVVGLPAIYRELAFALYVDNMDLRVYSARKGRMWREPGVQRSSGLYKVPLTPEEALSMTPEQYPEFCKAPRPLPRIAPPTLNQKLAVLYKKAEQKVAGALKRRKQSKQDAKLLEKFEGNYPPSLVRVMSGEGIEEGAGFQQIALQIAITSNALRKSEEAMLEACAGIIANHVSDGSRYNTPAKRRAELVRMHRYMDGNPLYEFSGAAVAKLAVPNEQTSAPDGAPDGEARKSRYSVTPEGVYYCKPGTDADGDPLPPLRVCAELRVTAMATDTNEGNWARALEFKDPRGQDQVFIMPMQELAGDATEVRRALLARGLSLEPSRTAREHLLSYLSEARELPHVTYTDMPGWCGKAYVLPGGALGTGAKGERVLYQGAAGGARFKVQGSVDEWRKHVAAPAIGNSRLTFAISAAFAAPLLHPVGVSSGGFQFEGGSSQGKTSIVHAAASVWGGSGYIKNWRATANGMEGTARQHNDGLLILDELKQVDAKEVGDAAYMLANGQGKSRAGKDGNARPVAQWRLLYLSTAELGLAAHMAGAGRSAEAGQEVRLAGIPADAERGLGVYETLHGRNDGAAFSDEVVAMAGKFHGAVGQAFLTHITGHYDEAVAEARALCARYAADLLVLHPDAEGQAKRVAARFALVAAGGDIATGQGLTGWPEGAAFNAAKRCFKDWLDNRGGAKNTERRDILRAVRNFIERHGQSRFQAVTAAGAPLDNFQRPISNRAGYSYHLEGVGTVYYVMPSAYDEICGTKSKRTVSKVLADAEWLVPGGGGKMSKLHSLGGEGQKRYYTFAVKAMTDDIE